jgi:hypothetical protein
MYDGREERREMQRNKEGSKRRGELKALLVHAPRVI